MNKYQKLAVIFFAWFFFYWGFYNWITNGNIIGMEIKALAAILFLAMSLPVIGISAENIKD